MTEPRPAWPGVLAAILGVGGLCWIGVRQVQGLSENPLRLDIFFHLIWTQEPRAVAVYFGVALAAVVLAWVTPARWSLAVVDAVGRRAALCALLVAVTLAAASVAVYRSYPISMDEFAAFQQAEIFASLRLAGNYPPNLFERLVPEFFLGYFFTPSASGDFASNYWPGHALLMAPFAFFGAPWLLNPVLTAMALLLVAVAARKQFVDAPEAAGWAMLFVLASPEVLANGMSFYSMTAHLVFNLSFALLLRRPTDLRVWAAGLVGGFALTLHQPVPHALFALPWALWILTTPFRWRRLGLLALGYVPFCLLLGLGWFAYRTELQREPLPPQLEAPVFGAQSAATPQPERLDEVRGNGEDAGPLAALGRLVAGAVEMPTRFSLWTRALGYAKLALWTVPGLPVLALIGLAAAWRRRRTEAPSNDRGDPGGGTARFEPMPPPLWLLLLAGSAATTLAFYVFVSFSQGHGWGFRYFFSAWASLPLLAAAAVVWILRGPRDRAFVAWLALLSLFAGGALRAVQIEQFIARQTSQLPPLPALRPGERAVAFVHPHRGYFRADLIRNDPFLRDATIYFVSQDLESDRRFMGLVFPTAVVESTYGEETVWRVPPAGQGDARTITPETAVPEGTVPRD